jgi:hypothetical protein
MSRLLTSEIQRVIVFGKKRVGKVHRRHVDVMRIYLGQPIKEVKPLFEARISREVAKLALKRFKADFEDNGVFLLLSGEDVDEKVRRLVVFGGARQTVDESLGRPLLEIAASMNEVEVLFWYSRFIDAFERGDYWDVYRVAKSLRTLYKI